MAIKNVPLPSGFSGLKDVPKLRESLVNLYNNGNQILKTPGLELAVTGAGFCRGSINYKESLYKVLGTDFVRISSDNMITVLGQIPGIEPVRMEPGHVFMSIIVVSPTGKGYTFSESSGLTQIADPDFKSSRDLAVIDGITVYIPFDGSPAIYSEINAPGNLRAVSSFDAEQFTDLNKAVFNLKGDLHILGDQSVEVFRTTGRASPAFARVDGAAATVGYIGGMTELSPSFAFIGRLKDQSPAIFIMAQGEAIKISNEAVDELINRDYRIDELEVAIGNAIEWNSSQVAIFRLARHTLWFSNGNWAFVQTGIFLPTQTAPWRANYITMAYGKYYAGDALGGNVGTLEHINTEYGDNVLIRIDTFARFARGTHFAINWLELDILAGASIPEGTIGLTVSHDGMVWQSDNTVRRDLGMIGQQENRVAWMEIGGLGSYESFAGLRFETAANVNFSAEGLVIDV